MQVWSWQGVEEMAGWWLEGQGSLYSGPGVEGGHVQRCDDGGGGRRYRGMDIKRLISAKR